MGTRRWGNATGIPMMSTNSDDYFYDRLLCAADGTVNQLGAIVDGEYLDAWRQTGAQISFNLLFDTAMTSSAFPPLR